MCDSCGLRRVEGLWSLSVSGLLGAYEAHMGLSALELRATG